MLLGICTIQRDRAPWIKEWVCFHYLMGFRKFYFFAHNCIDNTHEVILELAKKFDIKIFVVSADVDRPQLASYQYAYSNFGHEVDWMAFIDGDEFLFPVEKSTLQEALIEFDDEKISALAVYWATFGSSGHISEPEGLIINNYRYRLKLDHSHNQHIKSIVRGRQGELVTVGPNAHMFNTTRGTFDERMRPIGFGRTDYVPTHEKFRINHYTLQSWNFYKNWKQTSGAADAGRSLIRPDSHFYELDGHDEHDTTMDRFIPAVEKLIEDIS